MDTNEAKYRISTDEFKVCFVSPGILAEEGYNVAFSKSEDDYAVYLFRARGQRAGFASLDAAIAAARRCGWAGPVSVYP